MDRESSSSDNNIALLVHSEKGKYKENINLNSICYAYQSIYIFFRNNTSFKNNEFQIIKKKLRKIWKKTGM